MFATGSHSLKNRSTTSAASVRSVARPRAENILPIISLVGYTNAGKSTLLNRADAERSLRREERCSRRLIRHRGVCGLPYDQEVIINDTVGFIRDLPETLVSAFRATLEEIADSDLLVHVVDASNPRAMQQIESVEKILDRSRAERDPAMIVLNKTDLLDTRRVESASARQITLDKDIESVSISAIRRETLKLLVEQMAARIGTFAVDDNVGSCGRKNSALTP